MTVLKIESEFGHCVPPETDYAVTTSAPGWDTAIAFREGDPAILSRIVHIYPRFGPFGRVGELFRTIAARITIPEGHGLLAWTDPTAFDMVRKHCLSSHRKDPKVLEEELSFRVVDIDGTRLYATVYPAMKTPGIIGAWQNPGIGPSIRLAEDLLSRIDTLKEVECDPRGTEVPERLDALPESLAHLGIRQRITDLLHRAAIDPDKIKVTPGDVFLYQTGMAAIYAAHNLLLSYRPGTVILLGSIFHSTVHWISEQSPHGYKHFGPVDSAGLDALELFLAAESEAGRPVCYAFIEFPSNPLLASADLVRLKRLSETHGFVFIVDDTVGSFANIDVLPVSDLLITSLTKSFSGYADVMAGSTVLNPLSPHYAALMPQWRASFANELYARDAQVLLRNSDDYIDRTATLNRNAALLAGHLASLAQQSGGPSTSPLLRVLHPSVLPDRHVYESFLRRPAPELPEPGMGCLMNLNFASLATAKAFYNNLTFYSGPHLGAHKSLSLCYAALVFGKYPEEAAVHRAYGVLEESVRLSVGLERGQDLIETVNVAFEAAVAAHKETIGTNGAA